jgi:hypothetical protein
MKVGRPLERDMVPGGVRLGADICRRGRCIAADVRINPPDVMPPERGLNRRGVRNFGTRTAHAVSCYSEIHAERCLIEAAPRLSGRLELHVERRKNLRIRFLRHLVLGPCAEPFCRRAGAGTRCSMKRARAGLMDFS